MYIESLTNNRVKEWVKLKEKKYRDEKGLFIIEGEHLIIEAEKKNLIKEIISIDKDKKADFFVTKEIMKKISDQKSISDRIAICKKKADNPPKNKILILDGIQDPGNLGTMIRSAVAFNFDTIVLSNDSVDLYNPKVIRSSEGMLFHINIIRRDLGNFLKELPDYTIIATDVSKGKNIKEIELKEKFALIIGNEGTGIKDETKNYANEFVNLKMNSNCESLNAGVAASIFMYEMSGF